MKICPCASPVYYAKSAEANSIGFVPTAARLRQS